MFESADFMDRGLTKNIERIAIDWTIAQRRGKGSTLLIKEEAVACGVLSFARIAQYEIRIPGIPTAK